jgi:ComF family protein
MMRRVADALLSALVAPPCAVCARVLDRPLDGAVCASCWSAVGASDRPCLANALIASAGAVGEYEGVLREIVHALKYSGRRSIAPRLAQLMKRHGQAVLNGADAVVPVPLHPRRQRERGFNQADDLARGLGLPVMRALGRTRMTAPQVDLPAAARHRNVENAFRVIARECGGRALAHKVVVLIDDVTTTGATLEACALALRAAGVSEVRALTAARVASAPR